MHTTTDSPAITAALATIPDDDDASHIAAMARGLIRGYDAVWRERHQHMQLVSCEAVYRSPLFNLKTNGVSRTFEIAGKLDKLVTNSHGELCLYDHKTTSSDIADPDSTYWRQLSIESQPSHYELLLNYNGIRIQRVVWDVIRKPGIRPKKLAKKDLAAVVSLKEYFGQPVSERTVTEVGHTERENGELYEIRVAHEVTTNPDRYFARRGIKRTNEEVAEYGLELWDMATEMREARNNQRWYRNPASCMNYGTPCRYLGLCSGHDRDDSENWQIVENVHDELDEQEVDGRELITNSRLQCFQSCRKKHYYQYEQGLRKVDEEEREALYFGSLFHTALDAWWREATPNA